MPEAPSILSLAASGFYSFVVCACLFAALESRRTRQPLWHGRVWAAIALLFIIFILSRVFLIEEMLKADLREWLRSVDMFAERRAMQGPVIAVAIAIVLIAGFAGAHSTLRRVSGRRNLAVFIAIACCGVMFAIIAMRTISLHAMDVLLYGPLKLNWIGDLGASAAIIASAIYYVLLLRGKIAVRPR